MIYVMITRTLASLYACFVENHIYVVPYHKNGRFNWRTAGGKTTSE